MTGGHTSQGAAPNDGGALFAGHGAQPREDMLRQRSGDPNSAKQT